MDEQLRREIKEAKRKLTSLLLKKGAEDLTPTESNMLTNLMDDQDIQSILQMAIDRKGRFFIDGKKVKK